jgi:hypothetical protein
MSAFFSFLMCLFAVYFCLQINHVGKLQGSSPLLSILLLLCGFHWQKSKKWPLIFLHFIGIFLRVPSAFIFHVSLSSSAFELPFIYCVLFPSCWPHALPWVLLRFFLQSSALVLTGFWAHILLTVATVPLWLQGSKFFSLSQHVLITLFFLLDTGPLATLTTDWLSLLFRQTYSTNLTLSSLKRVIF